MQAMRFHVLHEPHPARAKSCVGLTKMACVRLLDGTEVMTAAEYSMWREELRGHEDGDCLFHALRRHLAKRFPVIYWHPIFMLGVQ